MKTPSKPQAIISELDCAQQTSLEAFGRLDEAIVSKYQEEVPRYILQALVLTSFVPTFNPYQLQPRV